MANYYQTLGVTEKATAEEIKKSYRRLAMMYHPDRNKSSDAANRFIEIQTAYDLLINDQLRARYDQQLRGNFTYGNVPPKQPTDHKKNTKSNEKRHRDINAPFENFSFANFIDYSRNVEISMRVFFLAIPGFFVSIFFLGVLDNDFDFNAGDYMVAGPFLIFHIFAIIDCFLPLGIHYALLMNVIICKHQKINELIMHITIKKEESLNYFKVEKNGFIRDSFYVKTPPEEFKNMQQFAIFKSFIFRNTFHIYHVVNSKLSKLVFNAFKIRNLCALGTLLAVANLYLMFSSIDNAIPYLVIIILEYLYITFFFTSNKIIVDGILGQKL